MKRKEAVEFATDLILEAMEAIALKEPGTTGPDELEPLEILHGLITAYHCAFCYEAAGIRLRDPYSERMVGKMVEAYVTIHPELYDLADQTVMENLSVPWNPAESQRNNAGALLRSALEGAYDLEVDEGIRFPGDELQEETFEIPEDGIDEVEAAFAEEKAVYCREEDLVEMLLGW